MSDSPGEYFCNFPAVDLNKKYTYAIVYARYPNQKEHLIVIGAIAISDRRNDNFVLQFFRDKDIKIFFQENILNKYEMFSEDWLAKASFDRIDKVFFIGTPFVVTGDSAEKICRFLHDKYEQTGYIIKDDSDKYKLD
jgi:hypothetical protein